MTFKDLPLEAEFIDLQFGSHWRKISAHQAEKTVEDDNAYTVGERAWFGSDEPIAHWGFE